MQTTLKTGLDHLQLPSDSIVLQRFEEYIHLLVQKNSVINLTAITAPEQITTLHFLDSLSLFRSADLSGRRIIDVGSGAGFPGLPLKLVDPTITLTLLDSLGKRVAFLSELCASLETTDVECIHARAEEQSHLPGYRDSYDFATSRAVAGLNLLCELCLPFVKIGGMFLAMKSTECTEELSQAETAIKLLGGRLLPYFDYSVWGTDVTHRVIRIEKISPTPIGYPRRFANIKKSPL